MKLLKPADAQHTLNPGGRHRSGELQKNKTDGEIAASAIIGKKKRDKSGRELGARATLR